VIREAGFLFFDRPGRREAAFGHRGLSRLFYPQVGAAAIAARGYRAASAEAGSAARAVAVAVAVVVVVVLAAAAVLAVFLAEES